MNSDTRRRNFVSEMNEINVKNCINDSNMFSVKIISNKL